jgi:hypothetical protein
VAGRRIGVSLTFAHRGGAMAARDPGGHGLPGAGRQSSEVVALPAPPQVAVIQALHVLSSSRCGWARTQPASAAVGNRTLLMIGFAAFSRRSRSAWLTASRATRKVCGLAIIWIVPR